MVLVLDQKTAYPRYTTRTQARSKCVLAATANASTPLTLDTTERKRKILKRRITTKTIPTQGPATSLTQGTEIAENESLLQCRSFKFSRRKDRPGRKLVPHKGQEFQSSSKEEKEENRPTGSHRKPHSLAIRKQLGLLNRAPLEGKEKLESLSETVMVLLFIQSLLHVQELLMFNILY